MSPSERMLKVLHLAIEQHRAWLDATPGDVHDITFTLKPKREGWRVIVNVESSEKAV